jgi:hypothetical protein
LSTSSLNSWRRLNTMNKTTRSAAASTCRCFDSNSRLAQVTGRRDSAFVGFPRLIVTVVEAYTVVIDFRWCGSGSYYAAAASGASSGGVCGLRCYSGAGSSSAYSRSVQRSIWTCSDSDLNPQHRRSEQPGQGNAATPYGATAAAIPPRLTQRAAAATAAAAAAAT